MTYAETVTENGGDMNETDEASMRPWRGGRLTEGGWIRCGIVFIGSRGKVSLREVVVDFAAGWNKHIVNTSSAICKPVRSSDKGLCMHQRAGLTWEEAKRRGRDGVEAACHNGEDSVTVSGPADAVAELVKELRAEELFARVVNTMDVAFHSAQMQRVGPALLKHYKEVIPEPKTRGNRWISSSVPESRWGQPIAQRCSAEYFVNNLVSPVLFCEALRHVPKDAIVVEFAPHCLLLSILHRELGSGASCLGLMKKDADNHSFFLGSLGKLHTLGVQLDPSALYPSVPWPLPRGTPNIGHLVSWDHTQQWAVASWRDVPTLVEGKDDIFNIDVHGNEDIAYLAGHRLAGEVTIPVGIHLLLAWKSLSRRHGKPAEEVPVVFENVKVHRNVVLPETGTVRLVVTIMYSSGEFEVCEEGTVAASGSIRIDDAGDPSIDADTLAASAEKVAFDLDSEDVYKELTVRGYDYLGDFRGILKADVREPCGKLRWKKNWVTFVDSVIQFVMFRSPVRVLRMPTTIEFLRFDPCVHAGVLEKSGDTGVEVIYNKITDTCHAGGVLIRGICTDTVYSDVEEQKAVVEEYHFVPYFDDTDSKDKRESLTREYVEVCCSVARRALGDCFEVKSFARELMNDLRDVPEHVVKQYLKERREGHGLLRFLHDVQKQAERPGTSLSAYVQSAMPTHKEDLEADILNTALFEEDPLRFLLDIAVENSSPKSFQILELAAQGSDLLLVTWLAKYISEYSLVPATQYIVAHPSPEKVSGKVPQGTTVMPLGSASSKKTLPEADLIVTRSATWVDKSGATDVAEELYAVCRENGFVLLAQRAALTPVESVIGEIGGLRPAATSADEVQAQFSKHGLRLVAFKSNNLSALYLFRKRSMALEEVKQEIVPVDGETGDLVDSVKRKALDYEWKPRGENMWLLAEEAGTSGVIGLANCLRHESGGGHIRCVLDAGCSGTSKVADFSTRRPEYKDVMEKDLVMNVYRNGRWGSYRHVVAKSSTAKNTRFAVLNVRKRGDPSSLTWYESPVPYNTPPAAKGATGPVMCDVHFAAVNSRDVRFATGNLLPETVAGVADMAISGSMLGQEFSGTDQTGLRVMGLVTGQALATVVAADPVLLWEVPDTWTMTEASTVPLSYATVYHALLVRGNMRPGESVLVHSGSGCLGQAAIAVALSMGCIVFASVGSAREKQFLKDRFPQLEDGNIVNYNGLCLEEYILDPTKGKGVDLVFHSLQSANRDVIIHCLAPNGRYLFHDAVDSSFPSLPPQGLSSKRKVLNVTVIRTDALHANDPSAAEEKWRVAELVREGISSGAVKPLPVTVFAREQASHAFTPEACEASTNKVVLQIQLEGSHQTEDGSSPFTIEAIARTYFYTHKAYVVVGEASSVALELVDWMVTRGCRKVLLTGGRGMVTGYQRLCLHRWQTAGASVVVSEVDVSTPQGALQVIKDAEAMGPVGGIFNVSLCHEDGLTADRATEARKIDYKTKVDGARHLDEHSRKMCSQLDHFVVFSSMCSGRGTPKSSLSGYVDSALERLCERRAADGFPGLAIQWGIIDGNSFNDSQSTEAVFEGTQPQRMKSFLEVMERFLNQSHPIVSSFVKAEVHSSSDKKSEKNHLVDSVTRILGFQDSSTLNQDSSLGELGLDSIMGVQILKVLEESTGLALSVQGIRHVTLNDLRAMSEERRVN
ncbi:hypothetical protein HPB51_021640 [Rhipicephalus microplus]|uniref:PKS/mFAS DH domain-containing protein n=1 Tax=Rhipicephalus microplus TaxID=6941 RepID=A0A9J6EUC4_RHIMP|nr:hypothetical protein HPB51_021640 [Rhipicephalus microplus]